MRSQESELNGLGSIIGHEEQDDIEEDWLDEITQTDSKKKNIINKDFVRSSDLKGINFETLEFEDEWLALIGEPSNPFYFMVFGSPGSGKSSMSLLLAKYLADNHNLKVGYFAKEEGISKTIQEKLERFNAYDDNLFIIEKLPKNQSFFDVLFLDSVSDAGLQPDDIERIKKEYPKLSLVLILHATKDGKYKGYSTFEHMVQTVIEVKEGVAKTGKNRFGAKGEYQVY